jgi:hypothetical protein
MEKELKIEGTCTTGGCKQDAPQELTREQLVGMLHQMSEQDRKLFEENKQLRGVIEEMNMTNLFKRLDYLFKVITEDNKYLTTEFKSKCAQEVEFLMTQPEQETPEE